MSSRVITFGKEKREANNGKRDSPDPGAYEVIQGLKAVKESSPEWTFSRQQKDGLSGDNIPGPGQYDGDINRLKHNVSYSMGVKPNSQNQSRLAKDYNPGPGQYDYHNMNKSPSFTMSPHKNDTKPNDMPGPGTYEYQHKGFGIDSRKITMSGRPQTAKNIDAPGPGQYDNKNKTIGGDKSQRGISAMRSKQERIQSPSKNELQKPGPGAYDANPHAVRDKTPTFRFGNSGRDNLVTKEEKQKPGPGAYEVKNLKSARASKMGQRLQQTIKNDAPGPGNYEPNHNFGKSSVRGGKISQQKNKSSMIHSKSSNNVGPGDYNVVEEFGKRAQKITIQGRKNNDRPKDIPGPGAYDPTDHLIKSKVTSTVIKSTKNEYLSSHQKNESTPGPGNYYRDEFGKHTKSFTIQGRNDYRSSEQSPGPGAYDARDNLTKSVTTTYKQSQSRREDLVTKQARELPGPGAYNYSSHKTIGKDVVTYTMGSKTQIIQKERSPGPGAYEPDHNRIKDKVKSLKMSTSQRPDIASKTAKDMPGPGMYSSPHRTIGKDSYQYSMGSKRQDQRANDIPGPGAYDAKDTVMRDKSPSFRLGTGERSKIINKSMIEQPGPGHYDQKSKETGPKFTFNARNEPKLKDDKPGPGNYEPINEVVKDKVRSYKMGSSVRTDIVSKEVVSKPGPGHYTNEHDQFGKNGQKVSIRGKAEQKIRNENPGPGQYQPNEQAIKDSVRAYIIDSTSKRSEIVTKEMRNAPGPGEYDSPKRFGHDAQSITIRGRQEQTFRDDSPGPGMYDPNSEVVKDKVRAFKMGQGSRSDFVSKEEKMKPGPGIYEQKSSIGQNTHSYSMGGKASYNYDNKRPGPGAYDANDSPTRYQSPSVMIRSGSKSARGELFSGEKLSQPGPGQYDQISNIGKGRAVQIQGKTVYEKISEVPGPGSYNGQAEAIKDRVKSGKIGQKKRDFLSPNKEEMQKPGPGYYDQKLQSNNITYSMGGKTTYTPRNEVPGPGQYDQSDRYTKYQTPSANFNRSPDRSTSFSPTRGAEVGPGMYDVNDKSNAISYSFSKGELRDGYSDTPGPGAYKLPSKFADVPPYIKMGNNNEDFKYV